ncbi:MAG: enoyl-CoA hydratase/isomerase family protein [Fidelibacterota bacterium]|nr:MAG: enoyl-CoA hydratase/isomerase family protein [Candidatus Neomarinimicrobiota bacterium]
MAIKRCCKGNRVQGVPPQWQHLHLGRAGWIATLTLSRPPMNALSREMVKELAKSAEVLAGDEGVSVVLIRSDQRHFCVGADLKEREGIEDEQVTEVVSAIRDCFNAIAHLPQPTIAAVHGSAVGGGAELALACDLRIIAEDARFGFSEVSLGIIPGAGGTQHLPRLIGPSRAKELIFSAKILNGLECREWGLADRVVPAAELDHQAARFAAELSINAPLALRAAKRAILRGLELPWEEALEAEGQAYDGLVSSQDRIEGLKAFLEKRKPGWRGR